MVTNGRTFWNVFELYFKALFRYENSTSACVLLTCSCGRPRSSRRSLKYRLFDSNLSLIEFVRKKRSVSPLTEPFLKLRVGTKRNACIGTFL